MSGFSRRFLIFNDNVCVGIFTKGKDVGIQNSRRLELVLSRCGEFVLVSRFGAEAERHMTRFVPSYVANDVKELLRFRNRHTEQPFLCERFHGVEEGSKAIDRMRNHKLSDLESYIDPSDGDISSTSVIFDSDMDSKANNDEEEIDVARCQFKRRLQVSRKILYHSDGSLISGFNQVRTTTCPSLTYEIAQVFPIAFAPMSLLTLLPRSDSDVEKIRKYPSL